MNKHFSYQSQAQITIERHSQILPYGDTIENLIDKLNEERGVLLSSTFEYPQRYTRFDIFFSQPPLVFSAKGKSFKIEALNQRGEILLDIIDGLINKLDDIENYQYKDKQITASIKPSTQSFSEEQRSKQPSIFTVIRKIIAGFQSPQDEYLGLYGTFGYDLILQFDDIEEKLKREDSQRDLVLYLPDEITIADHSAKTVTQYSYDFSFQDKQTKGLARDGVKQAFQKATIKPQARSHEPNEYANIVEKAKEYFARGDLFEVVPGQSFYNDFDTTPAGLFRHLRTQNPSPYGALINLGEQEYLVAASPEMFVRVSGRRIETCPISGTIARGQDALSDAQQITKLLNSTKDESELTMCTDVDRNDKSRICVPGSVRVIGRRQIEMYSKLIHTVDHVEGTLNEGYDSIDAFLTHMWVVTVTGAPKLSAMQFIENNEKTPRRWYAGAMGALLFNGDINTGLTIRAIQIQKGIAEVRVGATLLFDSDPIAEEQETELKASAMMEAIRNAGKPSNKASESKSQQPGLGKKILIIDHEDSFVHTLGNYFRQTGAEVITYRYGFDESLLKKISPDLVVLSPGPGNPKDFNISKTLDMLCKAKLPVFGICLGLQAITEYFGGSLKQLDYPMHGKQSLVNIQSSALFNSLGKQFHVGRYHSLYADQATLPDCLQITAESEDGIIMAIEHKDLPIAATQFHPESIMSLEGDSGIQLIFNVVTTLI